MKAKLRIGIVGVIALIVGGVVGDTIGARDTGSHFAGVVRQLALVHAAGEAAVYSQALKGLREGDSERVTERLEGLLDSAIIHFGDYYSPEVDRQEWIGCALERAKEYRTLYPHRPSSDWAARRYDAALAMKTESK